MSNFITKKEEFDSVDDALVAAGKQQLDHNQIIWTIKVHRLENEKVLL